MKPKTVHLSKSNLIGRKIWFGSLNTEQKDENTLTVGERKTLRKIFGPVRGNGVWKIRTSQELMDMCTELAISDIRKGTLR
jgi:hypothetical protein